MKITRIENQKNRPGRKNVYADGNFLIGVGAETLIRFGLRTGDEITPEKFRLLERTEELLGAKNAALRFLSVRPRSEREVRDRLREKEYADEDIERAITDLKTAGLLNDAEFARVYIRNAIVLRPTGRMALQRKLLLLGVDKRVIGEALEEELRGIDQQAEATRAAAQFLSKASAARSRADLPGLRRRLTGFLIRRGYTWDIVGPVVQQAVGGGRAYDAENAEGGD